MKKNKNTTKKLKLNKETLNKAQKNAIDQAHGGYAGSTGGPEACSNCAV